MESIKVNRYAMKLIILLWTLYHKRNSVKKKYLRNRVLQNMKGKEINMHFVPIVCLIYSEYIIKLARLEEMTVGIKLLEINKQHHFVSQK